MQFAHNGSYKGSIPFGLIDILHGADLFIYKKRASEGAEPVLADSVILSLLFIYFLRPEIKSNRGTRNK